MRKFMGFIAGIRKPYRVIVVISSIVACLNAIGIIPNIPNYEINVLSIVLLIIIGIYAVAFFCKLFFEKDIPKELSDSLKRCGIRDIHFNEDDNYTKLKKKLSESVEKRIGHIWILVYHGHKLLTHLNKYLLEAIGDGTEVHLLIASDNSTFMNECWEMEEKILRMNKGSVKEGRSEQLNSYEIIENFKKNITASHTASKLDNLKIKQYDTQARYALIMVEGEAEKWAWWTPYHPGIRVFETLSFVLEGRGRNERGKEDTETIYSQCKDHFDTLWKVAKPWVYPKENG